MHHMVLHIFLLLTGVSLPHVHIHRGVASLFHREVPNVVLFPDNQAGSKEVLLARAVLGHAPPEKKNALYRSSEMAFP